MRLVQVAAFSLCVLFFDTPADAAKVDDYAQAWPLTLTGDSAAWQIELTPEVYAAISDSQQRDLEVLDGTGNPVPLAAYSGDSVQHTPGSLIELPSFALPAVAHASDPANAGDESIRLHIERGADGRLRQINADIGAAKTITSRDSATAQGDLLLDASGIHEPLDNLRLDWSDNGASITAQFAISASDDLQAWRNVTSNATVLRLHQDASVLDRHDIALNGARAAYLRLHRLDDGAALPNLVVRARTLPRSTIARPAQQWLEATLGASVLHPPDQAESAPPPGTVYDYHLPAALTIRALKLDLATDNSLAHVRALSQQPRLGATPATWSVAADFVAFRLRQGEAVLVNDEIPIASIQRAQDWRIEPTTPLSQAPQLHVAFVPDRFAFLAQGQGPYRLVAGSARARRGDYPVGAALATLRTNLGKDWQPPLATLGPRQTLQGEHAMVPAAPVESPRDWKTWLLWGVLIGAAALIGGLALSLLRKQS